MAMVSSRKVNRPFWKLTEYTIWSLVPKEWPIRAGHTNPKLHLHTAAILTITNVTKLTLNCLLFNFSPQINFFFQFFSWLYWIYIAKGAISSFRNSVIIVCPPIYLLKFVLVQLIFGSLVTVIRHIMSYPEIPTPINNCTLKFFGLLWRLYLSSRVSPQSWLRMYGYLPQVSRQMSTMRSAQILSNAISDMQRFYGLEVTGQMDSQTIRSGTHTHSRDALLSSLIYSYLCFTLTKYFSFLSGIYFLFSFTTVTL